MRLYIYIISAISLFLVSACGADTNEDTATKEDNNNESELDWDEVFINDDQVNESFTRDIDSFKSTSPQYIESK